MTAAIVDQDWRAAGACLAHHPDTMFPPVTRPDRIAAAKAICDGCPVMQQCLQWAHDQRIQYGVYGGQDENERGFKPRVGRPSRAYQPPTGAPAQSRDIVRLAPHRERIRKWAAAGWTDQRIAARLGCSPQSVRPARKRWNIPAGQASGQASVEERPRMVANVENSKARFGVLNDAERRALWLRHAAGGGNKGTFAATFGVSWRVVRELCDAIDADARSQQGLAA